MPIRYAPKYYNPNWTKYSDKRKRWEAANKPKPPQKKTKITPVISSTSKKIIAYN